MPSLSALVGESLNGSVAASVALDQEMRPRIIASLQCRGATHALAEEIAADVLGDCSKPGEDSLLRSYRGDCEFESWLLRVAINRLIDRQRRATIWTEKSRQLAETISPAAIPHVPDDSLRDLVKRALTEAFASCEPEIRVMLWLTYAFRVKQNRVAKMWGWNESKISRALAAACEQIRNKTLSRARELEPGLTLLWEDIVQVSGEVPFLARS